MEKQYEETLQGKRSVKEIHLDKYGNMESVDTIEEGSKGNNIKLTIDLAFQDSVDALLKSYFNSELGMVEPSILKVCMQSPLTQKQVLFCLCQGLNMT